MSSPVVAWLLEGDPAIRWQALRDLTRSGPRAVARQQARVAREGWGARLVAAQTAEGQWAGLYTPKWTSTTYTMLLLRACGLPPETPAARSGTLVKKRRAPDGRWPLQNVHRGRYHFDMEQSGQPSRWNTLRALKVLRWWEGRDA